MDKSREKTMFPAARFPLFPCEVLEHQAVRVWADENVQYI